MRREDWDKARREKPLRIFKRAILEEWECEKDNSKLGSLVGEVSKTTKRLKWDYYEFLQRLTRIHSIAALNQWKSRWHEIKSTGKWIT